MGVLWLVYVLTEPFCISLVYSALWFGVSQGYMPLLFLFHNPSLPPSSVSRPPSHLLSDSMELYGCTTVSDTSLWFGNTE